MLPAKTLLNIFSCNLEKPKFSKCTPYLHKISSLIHLNVRMILEASVYAERCQNVNLFKRCSACFQCKIQYVLAGYFMHLLRKSLKKR